MYSGGVHRGRHEMSANSKIALAVAGGYLLGRTKKLRLAVTLAGMMAGKRLATNRDLLSQGTKLLEGNPQLKQLQGQLAGRLVDVAKEAAMVAAAGRVESLTRSLQDKGKRSAEDQPEDEEPELEEPEDETEEEPEDEADEEPEDEADEEPEDEEEPEEEPAPRRLVRKAPAKKTAAKTAPAKKAPAKKTAAKKTAAKKMAAKKMAAKKTAAKKTAASRSSGASGTRRTAKKTASSGARR